MSLQRARDFNPTWGARQVYGCPDPEMQRDYGAFVELLRLAKSFSVELDLSDSPCISEKKALSHVYFARLENTSVWKIGVSREPLRRMRSLQTGNQDRLRVRYRIPGERALEQAILQYTVHYRCRGRGGKEWRSGLTREDVRRIIRRVETEGPDFLLGPPLKPSDSHGDDR